MNQFKIDLENLSSTDQNQLIDWIRNERIEGLAFSRELTSTVPEHMGSAETSVLVFEALVAGLPVLTAVADSIINWLTYKKIEFTAEVVDPESGTKYTISSGDYEKLKEIVKGIENK